MNPDAQYKFIHATCAVGRLPAVEKAILSIASPECLLMVTPRPDGDFSIIVGVPGDQETSIILQCLQDLAGNSMTIGGGDTPTVGTYREGTSDPSIDF